MFNPRFLIVSLGNPGRYYETYHSAGHQALKSVQQALGQSQQPLFTAERYGGKSCQVSRGHPYIMVQSPVLMNVSGPWVLAAYNETLAKQNLTPAELSLVVVHDELEQKFGAVRTRKWDSSHRGHNGVKSALKSLKPANFPGRRWSRIAVGIDRPAERDQTTVADYVLQKMKRSEMDTIQSQVGTRVIDALMGLQEAWEAESQSS